MGRRRRSGRVEAHGRVRRRVDCSEAAGARLMCAFASAATAASVESVHCITHERASERAPEVGRARDIFGRPLGRRWPISVCQPSWAPLSASARGLSEERFRTQRTRAAAAAATDAVDTAAAAAASVRFVRATAQDADRSKRRWRRRRRR